MANGSVIEIKGLNEFNSALRATSERANVAARRIVERGALVASTEAKKVFRPRPGGQRTSKKTGKTYYSFVAPYQATPPTPTSRSGHLQTSIGAEGAGGVLKVTKWRTGWMATFGTAVSYAPYVEFGTGKMAKEPFMAKGLDNSRSKIQAIAEDEWAKAVA